MFMNLLKKFILSIGYMYRYLLIICVLKNVQYMKVKIKINNQINFDKYVYVYLCYYISILVFDFVCVYYFIIIYLFVGLLDDVENFQYDLRGVILRSFEYLFNLISEQQEKVGGCKIVLCMCILKFNCFIKLVICNEIYMYM